MDTLDSVIVNVNDHLWTYLLIPLVVGAGLYFTVRSRGVQLRLLPEMFRVVKEKTPPRADGRKQVSSFGAFTISAAARVGTGNIAGVAAAITLGGAGAVFWMWMMALIGAASAFVESALAQLYKVRNAGGAYRGGPAYYMQRALGKRWLGVLFAVTITVTFGFVFNAVQANTITAVASGSLADTDGSNWFGPSLGVLLAALLGLAVFGGVRRISSITTVLVPVMAIVYLLLGAAVVLLNITEFPGSSPTSSAAPSASASWRPAVSARPSSRASGAACSPTRRAWARPRTRAPPPRSRTRSSRASYSPWASSSTPSSSAR